MTHCACGVIVRTQGARIPVLSITTHIRTYTGRTDMECCLAVFDLSFAMLLLSHCRLDPRPALLYLTRALWGQRWKNPRAVKMSQFLPASVPWHAKYPAPVKKDPRLICRHEILDLLKSNPEKEGRDFVLVDLRRADHEVSPIHLTRTLYNCPGY